MNALYTTTLYNGNETEAGFTPDNIAYIVGMARLRQVRVENRELDISIGNNDLSHDIENTANQKARNPLHTLRFATDTKKSRRSSRPTNFSRRKID